jgi:hypothetical protein
MTDSLRARRTSIACVVAAAALAAAATTRAGEDAKAPADLPQGAGFAAKTKGDRSIAKDPRVLLAEDFETGEIAELSKRWNEVSNKDGKVLAWNDDRPAASSGKRSLAVTATLGENTGGHLYAQLRRGVERAFARFYVKFAKDAGYEHHFVSMGGHNPPSAWPNPKAGVRPEGNERLTVGIEPFGDRGRAAPPGVWNFYCYWHEMKVSADGRHWGNCLRPLADQQVPRDRWQCVEFMIGLNSDPAKSDGDLALWLDGKLVARFKKGATRSEWTGMGFRLLDRGGEPFEGLRWRTSRDLVLNYFWLLHYVTERSVQAGSSEGQNPVSRVFFDDVVVATEYVGPIAE